MSESTIAGADVDAELADLLGRARDDSDRRRARQLFALVLDTPERMKIGTPCAYCQAILSRFPLEAGISPRSKVLEETSAAELLRDAPETVPVAAGARYTVADNMLLSVEGEVDTINESVIWSLRFQYIM